MGKGDKKTKRGKIIMGSHGVRRPRKKSTSPVDQKREENIKAEAPKTKAKELSDAKM
ncbi:MAG TPA: 30S ribosomal protein THX, partial [Bacteroidales bacterium]|nr:30S ribosomal protein THX [Bacteroidales bacterium]